MVWQFLCRVCGAGLLIFSLWVFAWGIAPARLSSQAIQILVEDLQPGKSAGLSDEQPVAWLRYQWPEKLRKGDAGKVRLTFEWIESGVDKVIVNGLALNSQLDLAGIPHTPTGEISQALVMEHPVVFLWSLRGARSGEYAGKLWLRLQSQPAAADLTARRLLAAHSLEIRVDSLLGLSGDQGRVFGAVGMAAGILAGFSDVLFRWFIQQKSRFYA